MSDAHPPVYPYLILRLMPAVYVQKALPPSLTGGQLRAVTRRWAQERNLRAALVLGPGRVVYCEPDGTITESESPPSGGVLFRPVPGGLQVVSANEGEPVEGYEGSGNICQDLALSLGPWVEQRFGVRCTGQDWSRDEGKAWFALDLAAPSPDVAVEVEMVLEQVIPAGITLEIRWASGRVAFLCRPSPLG